MSDWKLPDLPSDEELGITDEDRKKYGEDLPDDGPEMTEQEMAALLGESTKQRLPPASAGTGAADKKRARDAKAEQKKKDRDEKRRAKQGKKDARRRAKEATAEKRRLAEGAAEKSDKQVTGDAEEPVGSPPTGGVDTPRAVVAPSARSTWRGPATLAILIVTATIASTRTGLPRPVPANAADTAFSSARAMSTLVQVARDAHPTGSPEHARVRSLIVERLADLGLDPEVQTAQSVIERPGVARVATVRNIVARIPGIDPTGAILVTAHYDSREIAVGAGDDGSGVVTILEAVRALRAGTPIRNDVIVLLTDAEELGLLGARAFVNEHPLMADVDLVLSFEMRGSGGPSIMFETNELNGWVVRSMAEWEPGPYANSLGDEVYRRVPNDTDFTPFKEAGVQGLNFATVDNFHVYHQTFDTPDNLSEATLQHHGLQALGALRHFGDADLGAVNASNVVYLTLPGVGLIVYGREWVLPISMGLVGLFALLVFVALRTGARPPGMLGGVALALFAGALAFGLASVLLGWLPRVHEEFGMLYGPTLHSEGWYMLALAFGLLALVTSVTSVARRWLTLVEISIGALVLLVIAAVVVGFITPLGAMNLQWPVAFALLATTILALLGRRSDGVVGWIAAMLLAIPVVLILHPVVELLWLTMSLRLAGVLAMMITVGLLLCLPALAGLTHPNAWWAPLTSVALAVMAMGAGFLAGRPSAERPALSTLIYAYEHATGDAVWATGTSEREGGTAGRAWAIERVSSDFTETRDLAVFGYPFGEVPVAAAPVSRAEPPAVVVVGDTIFSGARLVVLSVRSRIGAELLQFHMSDETRLNAINGVLLSEPEEVRRAEHWGVPENGVLLELSMPPESPIGVHVVEHLLRPGEVVGPRRFERPTHLAANVRRMSDRAMFRFSVAELADPRHAIVAPYGPDPTSGIDPGGSDVRTPPPDAGVPPDTLVVRTDTLATDTVGAASDTVGAPRDTLPGDTLPR
jgi:hypothetical protein